MKIYSTQRISSSQTFGMKVPVKTAIEAASGMFLRSPKVSNKKQMELLAKLGSIEPLSLYLGEVVEAMRNMRNLINKRHPDLALAAERISKACDEINKDRTFLPADEKIVNAKITQLLNDEVKIIGKKYIDIAPMSLEELGLDKYAHIK